MNTTWIQLERVYLEENGIGDKGGVEIGRNAEWKKLNVLQLKGDQLRRKITAAIGLNRTWTETRDNWVQI